MGETDRGQSIPKTPEEIPDEVGADLRASHEPSTEAMEIKKLRRKQQRLLNTVAPLRQQIRILKANQRIKRTAGKRKRATAANPAGQKDEGPTVALLETLLPFLMTLKNRLLFQMTLKNELPFQIMQRNRMLFH